MARLVLVKVGERDGLPLYAPENADDEKLCNNQNVLITEKKGDKAARTELQNRSLHLYFAMLSDAFNEAGLSVSLVLRKLFKSPNFSWSAYLIKERIWREVQEQTLGKESTTKLKTEQVSLIYDSINRATSDKLGVSVPFPDRYSQMYEQLGRK